MKYDQKQTEKWIKLMKNNDEQAYREFYEYWYPKCFYIALSITRNETDAKDAAQESMIEIHKSIDNLRDVTYFKLWLNRIVCSKCNRIFRKKKDFVMSKQDDHRLESIEENRSYLIPDQANHYATDQEVLQTLIAYLPYIYREVLTLMYFEHMSMKEIAECLQIPEGTVKSRLSTAKAKLKDEVLKYEHVSGVPLNFKETTLESLLIACYADYAMKHNIPSLGKRTLFSHKSMMFSTKAIMLGVGCVSVIVGSSVLLQTRGTQPVKENIAAAKQDLQTDVPVFEFKGMKVKSAKDAYFVLKQYAHCDYELQQLNEEEQKELADIKQYMLETSNIYTELLKK